MATPAPFAPGPVPPTAPAGYAYSGSVGYDDISNIVTGTLTNQEAQLEALINNAGPSPTDGQLLQIQMQMSQYTTTVGLCSTLAKSIEDTVKGILSKMG